MDRSDFCRTLLVSLKSRAGKRVAAYEKKTSGRSSHHHHCVVTRPSMFCLDWSEFLITGKLSPFVLQAGTDLYRSVYGFEAKVYRLR